MGSGKSTVAHLLRHLGFEVLDADLMARKVLSPGSPGEQEVFKTFGEHLRDRQGNLDRRALGRMVFADPVKLEALERIIHPRIRDEIAETRKRLAGHGHKAAFYDVPLLFEKKMQDQFDHILVVSAGKGLRHQRVKTRSQLTDEEIIARTKHHIPTEQKEAAASAIVRNDGSLEDLHVNLLKALSTLGITTP